MDLKVKTRMSAEAGHESRERPTKETRLAACGFVSRILPLLSAQPNGIGQLRSPPSHASHTAAVWGSRSD